MRISSVRRCNLENRTDVSGHICGGRQDKFGYLSCTWIAGRILAFSEKQTVGVFISASKIALPLFLQKHFMNVFPPPFNLSQSVIAN